MLDEISKQICQKIIDRCCETKRTVINRHVSFLNPNDKHTHLLEVVTDSNSYRFIVKRIPEYRRKNTKFEETRQAKYEKVLSPKFIIDEKHLYLGFDGGELNGYVATKNLDLEHIKLMLYTIAKYHTENLKNISEKYVKKTEYDHKRALKLLTKLYSEFRPEADLKKFKEVSEKLAYVINKIPKSELIPSIGRLCENNVYFKYENDKPIDCKIVKVGSKKYGPLAYDVLRSIFCKTDEKMRQHHLQDLLDFYYHSLENHITNLKTRLRLGAIYSKQQYYLHVKKLLPFVKLEMAFYYSLSKLPEDYFDGNDEEYLNFKAVETFRSCDEYRNKVVHFLVGIEEYIKIPRFNREDCYAVMNRKLETCSYELIDFALVTKKCRYGFLGDYFSLNVTIKRNEQEESFPFFAKFIPESNVSSRTIVETGAFKKEDFFYNMLLEQYDRYGIRNLLDFVPKCYFSRINDVLILEDKTLEGYSMMAEIRKPFDENTLRLVINNLAKLHASCLIFEDLKSKQQGETFRMDQMYTSYFQEIFYQTEIKNQAYDMLDCAIRAVIDYIIDRFPDICADMTLDEFKEKTRHLYDLMCVKMRKSDRFRNAINHGDLWATNQMFKFDKTGEVVDACLIDFQLIRYCPPAHDLMSLFYISIDKQTRQKCMAKLVDEYYDNLAVHMKKYDCDLGDIYSYEQFINSCNYMKGQAVCQATLCCMVTLCPTNKVEGFLSDQKKFDYNMAVDRKEFVEEMMEDPLYESRFRELIEELYDICKNEV